MSRSLRRRFTRLTLLNILANVTVPLVGLVDAGMLGHLPDLRFLAAVALASILFDYLFWSLNFLRLATTGLTAQARGRGDPAGATRILYRALVLALAFGALVLLLQPLLRRGGFLLLQVPGDLLQPATEYFSARVWSAPAVLANYAFFGWFLGREESGRALIMTLVANLGNIVLNYFFIIHLGWAALGAGIATAISQYLSLGSAVVLLLRVRRRAPWSRHVFDRQRISELLRLNGDIFVRTLVLATAFTAFTALSSTFGTTVLVINTLLLRLTTFVTYFVDGFAFAVESLAGGFWGSGDREGLRRLMRLALASSLATTALFAAAFAGAPKFFLGILTSHQEVITGGTAYAGWLVLVLLPGTIAFLYDGLFLGLTAGRPLRNAMLLTTLGTFAPLAVLAVTLENNHLLWLAMASWMLARGAALHHLRGPLLRGAFQAPAEARP